MHSIFNEITNHLRSAHQRARAERSGYREGRIPYGYALAVKDGKKSRVLNHSEQAIIVRIRELRAQNQSIAKITAILNKQVGSASPEFSPFHLVDSLSLALLTLEALFPKCRKATN